MNYKNILKNIKDRLFTQGKKKTIDGLAIGVLILSQFLPETIAQDIIKGVGALYAAKKFYDKD